MDSKRKHDFTNNCLRIEILQKLILEDLDAGKTIQADRLQDYLTFLEEQKEHIKLLFN